MKKYEKKINGNFGYSSQHFFFLISPLFIRLLTLCFFVNIWYLSGHESFVWLQTNSFYLAGFMRESHNPRVLWTLSTTSNLFVSHSFSHLDKSTTSILPSLLSIRSSSSVQTWKVIVLENSRNFESKQGCATGRTELHAEGFPPTRSKANGTMAPTTPFPQACSAGQLLLKNSRPPLRAFSKLRCFAIIVFLRSSRNL